MSTVLRQQAASRGAYARRTWLKAAVAAGMIVTCVDAYLLQRKKGFFTGGFLSAEHLDGWGERLSFITVSLFADTAFVGLGTAVMLWLLRPLRLPSTLTWCLALAAGIAPLAIADIVRFELDRYLGDAVDLSLMFDLVGGDVREFVAVGWDHSRQLIIGAALLATVLAVLLWLWRRRPGWPQRLVGPAGPGWTTPVVLVACAAVVASCARLASPVLDDALRRKASVDWPGALVDVVTDVDRDGFGLLGRPADFAPLDGRVHPYAIDLPGNGVDEDGVGGDLPAGTAPLAEPDPGPGTWALRRHVVLIMLESVRADAVGGRWNSRQVTPVLDALAAEGYRSQNAWSHNGYTVQSRHHVFSGSLGNLRGDTTLIDDFLANGYRVGYVSAQDDGFGSAQYDSGLDRAQFHYTARDEPARRYSTFSTPGSLAVSYRVVEEKVDAFLRQPRGDAPVFLYVNFHDTHFPYRHRDVVPLLNDVRVAQGDISPARREQVWAMYLNTLANVDAAIGRLLSRVREELGTDVGVIVLSDHGESLYEEGFLGHGYGLNEVQTRIPLIVHNLPMTIEEPWGQVQLRDAVRAALADGRVDRPRGRLRSGEGGVFQYLGSVVRPRQFGTRHAGGQVLYDVRTRRASMGGNTWVHEGELLDSARPAFAGMVALWERLRLARRGAERPAGDSVN